MAPEPEVRTRQTRVGSPVWRARASPGRVSACEGTVPTVNLSGTAESSVSKRDGCFLFFYTKYKGYTEYRKEFIMKKTGIATTCVQGGYTPKNGEPRQIPIVLNGYQRIAFESL